MKEMNQEELVADDIRKKKALDYLLEQVKWVDAPEETKEDTDETKKDDKSVEKESKSGYDKKADKKSAKDKTEEK